MAEIADVEAITNVINAAFKQAESFFIVRDRIGQNQVRLFLQAGEFLVAEDGTGLAGCVYLERREDRGYIGLLAVDPSRQRSGLGSQLMAAAEDRCRQLGCHTADLQIVNLREELPDFYRRRGYLPTGTAPFRPDLVTKMPCHFIKMSKPLTNE
ncbi:MAG: GNAT family N-acetyltransferase [Terriglobales bacterium]